VHAKKIVHPLQREFAIGAIAEKGETILNTEVDVEQTWIDQEVHRVREEIARRRDLYDTFLKQEPLKEKEIILVDDGIATGMTMFAAIEAIKNQQPNKITVAVPIIPEDTYNHLKTLLDDIIYIEVPEQFLGAVGAYYQQSPQMSDEEMPTMIKQLKNELLYLFPLLLFENATKNMQILLDSQLTIIHSFDHYMTTALLNHSYYL